MSNLRTVIRTYEPDGVFNHYCILCKGKNWCTCHDDSDPICGCGKLAYACTCKPDDQVSDIDLILSSIATATSSKIQDNINMDCWRYLIVKHRRGLPTRIVEDEIVVNNIKFKLSDPCLFQNLNELFDLPENELITRFLTANVYGLSIISPQAQHVSNSQFMMIFPNRTVGDIWTKTRDSDRDKFDGIILSGIRVGYNHNLNENIRTQEVPYP